MNGEEDFAEGGTPPGRRRTSEAPQVEMMLQRLHDVIDGARPMPLSTSVMVNREELLEMVEEVISRLPEDVRASRWLLKEREEFLAKVKREGDDILDQARARAERMVQRTEVVKAAEQRARRIVERAEEQARDLKHQAEDFCDHRLASFEIILERTQKMVASGRAKLQGGSEGSNPTGEVPQTGSETAPAAAEATRGPQVFDQDG